MMGIFLTVKGVSQDSAPGFEDDDEALEDCFRQIIESDSIPDLR